MGKKQSELDTPPNFEFEQYTRLDISSHKLSIDKEQVYSRDAVFLLFDFFGLSKGFRLGWDC